MNADASVAILYPILVLVAWTFVTATRMYLSRVAEMKARRIHPNRLANRSDSARELADTRAADHYANLFEAPVLFYLAGVLIWAGGLTDEVYLALAWLYVAARLTQGMIHLTYNRVMHRFIAFVTGLGLLLVLWLKLAWDVLGS